MKSSELMHAESQRLFQLSDNLVNTVRPQDGAGADALNQLLHGVLALAFAGLTIWVASWFDVDKELRHLIFAAQIVLYGCLQICSLLSQNFAFYNKLLDNINASRFVMVDIANKLGYIADKP